MGGGGGGGGGGMGGPPRPPNGNYGQGLGPNGGLGGGPSRGESAIECTLYEPLSGESVSLESIWSSNDFLCISFGSCSCNMFRDSHADFENVAAAHRRHANVGFLSIYISEAHPKDGWSFGKENGRWDINQATTLEERRRDCRTWQSSFRGGTRYLCDGMDNREWSRE